MADSGLRAGLLPLVFLCDESSNSVMDVLQNARRERARRLKVKKFKRRFSQRKVMILLGCSILFMNFFTLLLPRRAWLSPRLAVMLYVVSMYLWITIYSLADRKAS